MHSIHIPKLFDKFWYNVVEIDKIGFTPTHTYYEQTFAYAIELNLFWRNDVYPTYTQFTLIMQGSAVENENQYLFTVGFQLDQNCVAVVGRVRTIRKTYGEHCYHFVPSNYPLVSTIVEPRHISTIKHIDIQSWSRTPWNCENSLKVF